MNERFGKIRVMGILLAGAMTLAACGGGDNTPAPVPDVVVMMKAISRGAESGPFSLGVALNALAVADVRLLEIRCSNLTPPPGLVTPGNQFVLLVDVSAADAIKAKALGFQIFGPDEQSRRQVDVCA